MPSVSKKRRHNTAISRLGVSSRVMKRSRYPDTDDEALDSGNASGNKVVTVTEKTAANSTPASKIYFRQLRMQHQECEKMSMVPVEDSHPTGFEDSQGTLCNSSNTIPIPTLDYLQTSDERFGGAETNTVKGRRIIAMDSFTSFLENVSNHGKHCQTFDLAYDKEVRNGLETELRCKCKCGFVVSLTSSSHKEPLSLNKALAWGCNGSGTGLSDIATVFTALDIPVPCPAYYRKFQTETLQDFENVATKIMKENAEEEKRLAILAGDFIEVEGKQYVFILVKVDGQWGKRTYGHGYDANCGSAVIIGARTGKVLYFGTRTNTCFVCKKAESKNEEPKQHDCYKNWSKASTAMEADIIAEGFRRSIADYGLVYSRFVGDGDSSVYKNVINAYPGITVVKVECSNHLIKNFRKHLINISNNTARGESIPREERKIKGISEKFERICRGVVAATNHYAVVENAVPERWKLLHDDIMNIPMHVFGDHLNCKPYFCTPADHIDEPNQVELMSQTVLWKKLFSHLRGIASKSRSLVEKQNTNAAEAFMSVCNKYLEGKRKNFGQRYLYRLQIICAVLSYNTTSFFLSDVYSRLFSKDLPESWVKKKDESASIRATKQKPKKFRKLGSFAFLKETKGDSNYGSCPVSPDMDEEDLQYSIEELRKSLQLEPHQIADIESKTRQQSGSELWMEQRKNRITASVAGEIFKMRDRTNNTGMLNKILQRKQRTTEAMRWGLEQEEAALLHYIAKQKCVPGEVTRAGLVVDKENGIFAASPDAFVGEKGLVEIKCPWSCRDELPTEWSVLKQKNGTYLSKSHRYYRQIVMQLHVTGRNWCDFVVWTKKDLHIETFYRDAETLKLWNEMVPKLTRFWGNELAPEIVDSRYNRNMNYRVPPYRAVCSTQDDDVEEEKDS